MAIRIKLKITFKGKQIETSALANAGYESDENEILVPENFAKKFRIKKGKKVKYHTAGGDVDFIYAGKTNLKVVTEDKESKTIVAKLIISKYEDEVIINDKSIGNLGIVLFKIDKGIWRFLDDPPDVERQSEEKQSW